MRPVTKRETVAKLMRACDLLGLPHVYDARGEFLPKEDRPEQGHALDFGGGSVRGVCVYRLLRDGGGHIRPADPFFRVLDMRRPHRDVSLALAAIVEALEAVEDPRSREREAAQA